MCCYNRYMVGLRWASVHAAQSDINEDLQAAELKYTVLNVFNVMVLIIAACLLGLMSNTTLSNNSTQTHDLFRLYMIRSKQLFLNSWLWAWNIYLFEWLKFDWTRGGSRGGARGAPAPVEIWLAPEVPLSCQSLLIYIKLSIGCVGSSFENQPAQRFLSTTASAVFPVTVFVPFTGSTYSKLWSKKAYYGWCHLSSLSLMLES